MNAPAKSLIRPGVHLSRAAYAVLVSSGGHEAPADVLRQRHGDDRATLNLLHRAAVSPATPGDPAWAGTLAATATLDFLATLPASAGSRLLAASLRTSLDGVGKLMIPTRQGPAAPDVAWIPAGGPIPVRRYTLQGVALGPTQKLAAIVVMTAETALSGNGEAVFRALLQEDAALSLDASLFSDAPGSEARPAGLLAGIEPLAASPAGEGAMEADLQALAGAVFAAGGREVAFAMNLRQYTAAALRLRNGDRITLWPSAAIPPGIVVAIDPTSFVASVDDAPRFDTGAQAAVHLDDAPQQIATPGDPATVAAPVVSLWQSDCLSLRMVVSAAWTMRAPALAWAQGVAW